MSVNTVNTIVDFDTVNIKNQDSTNLTERNWFCHNLEQFFELGNMQLSLTGTFIRRIESIRHKEERKKLQLLQKGINVSN